jgi:hypothetical protein
MSSASSFWLSPRLLLPVRLVSPHRSHCPYPGMLRWLAEVMVMKRVAELPNLDGREANPACGHCQST